MATITLKDSSAVPGALVYLTGEGFDTGETVNLFVRGQIAGALPCDGNGAFAGHLQLGAAYLKRGDFRRALRAAIRATMMKTMHLLARLRSR